MESKQTPLRLDMFVEKTPQRDCFVHIPALPGLCFRADGTVELGSVAQRKVVEYVEWLVSENLSDLTPTVRTIAEEAAADIESDIRIVRRQQKTGAPVWISGNATALFVCDRQPLTDEEVAAHLRFVRRVVCRMRISVASLSPKQRAWKPSKNRRSILDTVAHLGNCIWWYCSRIDDELPEPEERTNENPFDRIDRLLDWATEFLLGTPFSLRSEVHVPRRFPTKNPREKWTHTKACRRQAEHMWEHLGGMERAVTLAARSCRRG